MVYRQVYATAKFSNLNYWLGIIFSAGIAIFGLIQDSSWVGSAVGDLYLTIKAIANLVAGVALAIGFSALIVWLLPFHSPTGEMLSRANPMLPDLGIALFSGLAGALLVGRAATTT